MTQTFALFKEEIRISVKTRRARRDALIEARLTSRSSFCDDDVVAQAANYFREVF